jgi:hypothetical protein
MQMIDQVGESSRPIKQHYVPRFYLHRFRSNMENLDINKSRIYCFDKRLGRSFLKNIKDVAYVPHLYGTTYADGSEGTLEYDLSIWERESRESIECLVELGWDDLPGDHRHRLARFVALQLYRTDEIRKRLIELGTVLEVEATSERADDRWIAQAIELLLRDLQEEQQILLAKTWELGQSGSRTPLWLSDVPVTRFNVPDRYGVSHVAIGAPGLELYIPLSPVLGLRLSNRKPAQPCDSQKRLSAADIDFRNRLQVTWSRQFIFSSVADFQRAEAMIQENESLRDPDRPTHGLPEFARSM